MTTTVDVVKGGAVADGTTLVAGGSGNTDLASLVVTEGTATSRADYPTTGKSGARFNSSTGSGNNYGTYAFPDSDTVKFEIPLRVDTSAPAADTTVFWLGNATTRLMSILLVLTSRFIRVRDAGASGGQTPTGGTGSTAFPLSANDSVLLVFIKRSTGNVKVQLWTRGASSPTASMDLTMATPGSLSYNMLRVGAKTSTSSSAFDSTYGDIIIDTAATDIGYPSWLQAPVVPGSPTQTRGVWLDLSGTTVSVGPVAFSASPSTGVKTRSDGLFLPAPSSGTTTYAVTATDTGTGLTTTFNVDVDASAGIAQPRLRTRVFDGTTLS